MAPAGRRRTVWVVVRWLAAIALGWFGVCLIGLAYVRFFPPLTTALQIHRWLQYGTAPGSASGFVPLKALGPHLPHAVVAAEDTRFFEHHGLDWLGLQQAMEDNWRRGRLRRGGSTITQQLVKNLFLSDYGSFARKLYEVPLTVAAELILSKQRILELYLNVVEFGPGIYGSADAGEHYYGVPPAFLGRDQAARLAACLPNPRTRRPQRMTTYAALIRRRMTILGW